MAANTTRNAYLMYQEVSYERYASFGPFGSQSIGTYSDAETYWTDEQDDHEWTSDGTTTLTFDGSTVTVEVWTTTYTDDGATVTETQYIGTGDDDGWVVYKIEYTSTYKSSSSNPFERNKTTTTTYTYTLDSYGTDTTYSGDATLEVYAEDGLSVTSTYADGMQVGDTVTLTASGEDFSGWYDGSMTLLSTASTYTYTLELGDNAVYAISGTEPDTVDGSTDLLALMGASGLTDATWTLYDSDGEAVETWAGTSSTHDFGSAGNLYLVLSGTASDGSSVRKVADVYVDGSVTKTYTWTFENQSYTVTLDIRYSDYEYFASYNTDGRQDSAYTGGSSLSSSGSAKDVAFVTTTFSDADDAYIEEIASKLKALAVANGFTSQQGIADFVLSFVQSAITYAYDTDTYGAEEYWAYPLETLYNGVGDCEDTSILYCAIMDDLGYSTALFLMSGHMAAGVLLSSYTDESSDNVNISSYHGWTSSGKTYGSSLYYYCETTASGWYVGDMPSSVQSSLYGVMAVERPRRSPGPSPGSNHGASGPLFYNIVKGGPGGPRKGFRGP